MNIIYLYLLLFCNFFGLWPTRSHQNEIDGENKYRRNKTLRILTSENKSCEPLYFKQNVIRFLRGINFKIRVFRIKELITEI